LGYVGARQPALRLQESRDLRCCYRVALRIPVGIVLVIGAAEYAPVFTAEGVREVDEREAFRVRDRLHAAPDLLAVRRAAPTVTQARELPRALGGLEPRRDVDDREPRAVA